MEKAFKTDLGCLHLGDCLQELPKIESGSIGGILTDPPYSSGGMFRGDRCNADTSSKYQVGGTARQYANFAGDNRDQRGFAFWSIIWASECFRVLKSGGVACFFSDWRQLPTMTDVIQAAGFVWRGIAVWDKTEAARPTLGRFRAQSEFIIWGSKGPLKTEGAALPGVWRNCVVGAKKVHVTEKPVPVVCEILRIFKGGPILDPFMGGGTTAVACEKLGLPWLGYEKEPAIFDVACQRLKRDTRQMEITI